MPYQRFAALLIPIPYNTKRPVKCRAFYILVTKIFWWLCKITYLYIIKQNKHTMKHEITAAEIQQKLQDKQTKLALIVGSKEAARLMERALQLVKEGKKSITDIIDL